MLFRRFSRDLEERRSSASSFSGGVAPPVQFEKAMASKVVDFPTAWTKIYNALATLMSGPDGSSLPHEEWMALYTDIYRLCTQRPNPQHERLYHQLHDFLVKWCQDMVATLLASSSASASLSAIDFLAMYARHYRNYSMGMVKGAQLLAYLDRYWVCEHHFKKGRVPMPGVLSISELVPLIWKDQVLLPLSSYIQNAFSTVVAQLRDEPNGPSPPYLDILKAVVLSYVSLGQTLLTPAQFYKTELEDYLLEQVSQHYHRKAHDFLSLIERIRPSGTADCVQAVGEYIRVVQNYIAKEEGIWYHVHEGTSRGAVRVVRKSMLESEPHHELLMSFAAAALEFRHERREDLALLYKLLDHDDVDPRHGIDALRQIFFNYVRELGAREVKRTDDDSKARLASPAGRLDSAVLKTLTPNDYVSSDAVQVMLDLYSHYLTIVRLTFDDDSRFAKAFKQACEHFINHLPHMAESLAWHAHTFLDKTCHESRAVDSVDVALDSIILLFNFIHDKDLFHRCYGRLLGTRIINFSSVSDEAEQRMMRHLRQVCGFQYAMTFQRMFMDKQQSVDLTNEFTVYRDRGLLATVESLPAERSGPSSGHLRRKSDSSIDYVELDNGHVTPRVQSPNKAHPTNKFFGLHDASPLQMLLSKRVFAEKSKRYKESMATPSTGGTLSARVASTSRTTQGFFFGEDDMDLGVNAGTSDDWGDAAQGAADIDLFVFVLTGGSWPYQPQTCTINLPGPLARCMEGFSRFYDHKFKRDRRLAWLHELGHGEVVVHGMDKAYTLNLSTFQMAAVTLFNHQAVITLKSMADMLELDASEVALALFPLIKGGLLTCNPTAGHVSQLTHGHSISVNKHFTRRSLKVLFPRKCEEAELVQNALSPHHMDPTRISPSVLNERKAAVEARVVWLMKQHNTLRHDKLVEGVLDHARKLNFLPPRDFVCDIIRSDIEKDFLELVEDGPNPLYRYQA